jgi:hypothetical protein
MGALNEFITAFKYIKIVQKSHFGFPIGIITRITKTRQLGNTLDGKITSSVPSDLGGREKRTGKLRRSITKSIVLSANSNSCFG